MQKFVESNGEAAIRQRVYVLANNAFSVRRLRAAFIIAALANSFVIVTGGGQVPMAQIGDEVNPEQGQQQRRKRAQSPIVSSHLHHH